MITKNGKPVTRYRRYNPGGSKSHRYHFVVKRRKLRTRKRIKREYT